MLYDSTTCKLKPFRLFAVAVMFRDTVHFMWRHTEKKSSRREGTLIKLISDEWNFYGFFLLLQLHTWVFSRPKCLSLERRKKWQSVKKFNYSIFVERRNRSIKTCSNLHGYLRTSVFIWKSTFRKNQIKTFFSELSFASRESLEID